MATGKIVRSISAYEAVIRKLGQFRIVHPLPDGAETIRALGFDDAPNVGDQVLPSAAGKISDFNANGKLVIRKDLPKVPESRMGWRTWKDWHGNPHSGIQIRKIDMYPRERVMPPGEYLTVLSSPSGLILSSRVLSISDDGEEAVVHLLNLFLEILGSLELVGPNLESTSSVQVKRLNWKILPPGPYPFNKAKKELSEYLAVLPDDVRPVIEDRVHAITSHGPDFLATGLGGFHDYVVFGFTELGRYVFESPALGNATYVFSNDWRDLSVMTKKQILDGSLQEARVIHNHRWRSGLKEAVLRK